MPQPLQYPDLSPPQGWTYAPQGSQIRLIPPGTRLDTATAAIIVSPLVARSDRLPPLDRLIEMALDTEEKLTFQVTARTGPTPVQSDTGLSGLYYDVRGYVRPSSPPEHRLYVMYSDPLCYYGINYVASDATYPQFLDLFWEVARSIQPFRGRAVTPPAPPAPVDPSLARSPLKHYED